MSEQTGQSGMSEQTGQSGMSEQTGVSGDFDSLYSLECLNKLKCLEIWTVCNVKTE